MFKQCPNCACDITDAGEYCPACGSKIIGTMNNQKLYDEINDNRIHNTVTEFKFSTLTIKCQHCKKEFNYHDGDQTTCPNCGYPFDIKKIEEIYKRVQQLTNDGINDGSIKFRKFNPQFGQTTATKNIVRENEVIDYQSSMQSFDSRNFERHGKGGGRRRNTAFAIVMAVIMLLAFLFFYLEAFGI